MGVHLAAIGKLNALLGGGGHSNFQILASLLFPFILKLPLVTAGLLPNSISLRFFLFRLRRVFHHRYGRWDRVLRLLRGGAGAPRLIRVVAPSDETVTTISMLTLNRGAGGGFVRMAVNYLYLSVFSTSAGLVLLQWWMVSSLEGMKADGPIGEEGGSGSSVGAGGGLELLLNSRVTVVLLVNFVINVYFLVASLLKMLFFVQLNSSETRKVLERFIHYIIYKAVVAEKEENSDIGQGNGVIELSCQQKQPATVVVSLAAVVTTLLCLVVYGRCKGTFLPLIVPPKVSHVILWSTWLIFLCSIKIFQSIARDRLEKLNASPSVTPLSYFRVYSALLLVLLADLIWMKLCMVLCSSYISSLFLLLFFEPLSIAFDTLQTIMVHGFQFIEIYQRCSNENVSLDSDIQKTAEYLKTAPGSLSEWKGILIRHCGFILDMMTLLTALGHYFVIWWLHGLAFHLVDVVLFLNMRALISAIAKRIRTYLKLRKALTSLDGALPDATYEELRAFDDECAICRKVAGTNGEGQKTVMQSSIPSRVFEILLNLEKHSHTFVKEQLDQGLTDVYSCPTCRRPLFTSNVQGGIRSASGNAIDGQQVAEHLNLGLNQQRVPGHAPLGASPNPSQNTSDTIWRGAAFDSSLTPTWMNQGIDGASSSSSVTSVGFGGVQMMMRQLASVSENFAQGSLHDSAWNLWLPQHTAIPHIPPSSSTRLNRNAAGLRIRNATSPVNSNMSELLTMVDRVREVLPHVPDELIVQDLLRTNNINITVNNLLVQ
ncbi:hypothetical protein ZIOFF_061298 [Zingiber officinale]|uniref:CUE domain-containing protein n=1 Tax=Zingiber officinale TaxID=94328 RepID=A0A8J5K9N6_ZINOF|nr:hypothetical protein ZIOFF_061298 [Zingiber officinale]